MCSCMANWFFKSLHEHVCSLCKYFMWSCQPVTLHLFPLQIDSLRAYKGDFFVASIFVEDISNPLVNTAKVLKLVRVDLYLVVFALSKV